LICCDKGAGIIAGFIAMGFSSAQELKSKMVNEQIKKK
jgi:hypothetical protein